MEQSESFRKNRDNGNSVMLVVPTTRQLVHHMYTKCRKWRRERRVLRKELRALGIGWQHRPEKIWVANPLANEQAVQPLLKYLKTTEVGGREGGAERAVEWEQRTYREGEELLDSG